jgi:hypothetical protein
MKKDKKLLKKIQNSLVRSRIYSADVPEWLERAARSLLTSLRRSGVVIYLREK